VKFKNAWNFYFFSKSDSRIHFIREIPQSTQLRTSGSEVNSIVGQL